MQRPGCKGQDVQVEGQVVTGKGWLTVWTLYRLMAGSDLPVVKCGGLACGGLALRGAGV